MAITPADIEQLTFSPSKHGYDTEEVDAFLEQCAGDVDAMLQKIADLKGRLTSAEQQLAASQEQVKELQQQLASGAAAPQATIAAPMAPAPASGLSEHQISAAILAAQQTADRMVAEARENAEHIRNEADQKAREVIRQALAEKQSELDEIDRLKTSREDFRSEYKKLLQHFIDDAETVMPVKTMSAPTGSNGTTHDGGTYAPAQPVEQHAAPVAAPAPAAPAQINLGDLD